MENSTKLILLGVGLIITALIVTAVMTISGKGTELFKGGMSSLDSATAGLSNLDKQLYDGTTMSGSDVIDTINKYKDTSLYVVVNTRDGSTFVYNSLFDPESAEAATIAEDYKEVNAMFWELGGWPVNCWASANTPEAIKTKLPDGADASTTARFGTMKAAPKGGYDATSTSSTEGYLSGNASFAATIQVDKNNDVRSITFIQK